MQFIVNLVIACILFFISLAAVVIPVLGLTDDYSDKDDKKMAACMLFGFFGCACLWLLVEMIMAGLLAPLL